MHEQEFVIGVGVHMMYILIGEQAKRARRYLVMFMEVREYIYIYAYVCF